MATPSAPATKAARQARIAAILAMEQVHSQEQLAVLLDRYAGMHVAQATLSRDLDEIGVVLDALTTAKFSADNVAFGMGGGLLQKVDRDTMKWAMKASAIKINGFWQDVYKDPVTDHAKISKKGRQALVRDAAGWRTVPAAEARENRMTPVYRDGKLLSETSFDAVRARADAALKELHQE